MKKTTKLAKPLADIPMYLSASPLHADKASDELTHAYSLLNSSLHVYTTLSDEEKERYLAALKDWLQAVDA